MSGALLKTRMRRAVLAIGLIFAAAIVAPAAMAASNVASVTVSTLSATALTNGPKITSDKPDYHPDEIVTLTGTGWKPGEPVTMVIVVDPPTHKDVTLTAVADANGNFKNSDYVVQQSDLGVTFHLAATGATGDIAAPLVFTDSIGTPAGIGTNGYSNTNHTTLAITSSAAVPVGNTVIVAVNLYTAGNTITVSVADSKGNTYTNNADVTNTGGPTRAIIFSAPVTTALTTTSTVTVTFSRNVNYANMSVFQVSGLLTASPVDKTATNTNNSGSTAATVGPTATTTQSDELLIGAFGLDINTGSPTMAAGTGYTALPTNVQSGGWGIYPEYQTVSATGAYSATGTFAPAADVADWSGVLVAYKSAATQLAFTTSPVSINTGVCSPLITVQSQDTNGTAASPSTTETIALSTSGTGGAFYSNSTCTTAITSVTIANTANSASFYWTDTTVGTPTITASGTGAFTSAPTQTETVTTLTNPVPTITSLSPPSATAGAAAQTLTINGTGFVTTSTATYNGVAHTLTYVSSTQVTIQLSAGDQATAGTYPVVVTNPAPGGGSSNSVNFTVNNSVPTITTLSPSTAPAGSAAQTLTINGTNFLTTSTVTYNSVAHAATYISGVQLTIQLSTGDQATAGTYPVVVTNPAPGGGASNSVNFTVSGAAAKLVFSQQPTNTVAGASITPSVTVQVQDSNGNLVTNSTASVTIAIGTNPGSGTLSGTAMVNAVAGVATFSGLSINKTGTGYTLAASSTGLTGATSTTFNITPSTATQLAFSTQPGGGTGGVAWSQQPVVTVEDAFGNTVTTGTGSTASITLAIGTNPSSGTLSCTTNPLAAIAGVATFAGCKINSAGTGYTLTAAATSFTTITSSAFNITAGTATKLAFVQQPTNTVAGSSVTPSVTVQLQDAGGNSVTTSGTAITMAVGTNPGGSTLGGTTSQNTVNGLATFNNLTLNKVDPGYTLVASSTGLTSATSGTFNITPGVPTQVVFTTQPSTPDTSGTAFTTQPKASIEDANGNVVTSGTGSTDSITLAIGTNPSSGTLTCTNTTVTAAAGVATWAGCKINLAGAGYTLTATDNTETLTVATSNAITINAGTAAQLVFTTEPSATATGGTPFAQQPVVTVEDANGNAVTTSTTSVALAITNGTGTSGATLACNTNPLTDTSGISSFSGCNINLAGTGYTLTATATGLTSAVSSAISVSIGSAAKLAFSQQPTNTADGSPITPAVTVSVEDAGGNVVTSSTASIGIAIGTNPGGSTLTGTTPVSAVNGVATFSNLSLNKVGTGYTLSATSTGLTTATSSTFNIIAATATQLVFSTEPSTSAAAGAAFATQPKVTVEDANGNPVTSSSASITLAITSGTGTTGAALACTTNPVTAASGIATFAGCNINLVGTGYTLTATSGALTAGVSTAISITPGTATKLIFTTEPSAGATGGTAFTQQPVVSVEDANGNVVTTNNSASITLAINTGTGVLTCTTNPVVASSGVAAFAGCRLTLAGSYTLKATATGLTTAISTTIVVSVGPEAKLAFTTQPTNTAAGSTITPSVAVSVEDAGGNVVGTSTDSITVAIGTNPGSSTLSGTTTVNAVNGVATFSTLSLNKVDTGYTLVATDSTTSLTTATSSTFNITPGAGTQLVFTTQPGGGTGGVAWSQQPVVTVEDADGNTVTTGTNSTASITLAIGTNPGGGTLSCTANPKPAVAGVDTFAGCKITSAGTGYTLTASATGLTTATSASFNVTAGPATQLAFIQQPTSTTAAQAITPAVTVQVEDAGGNLVNTSTASIVMAIGTNPSGGTLSGTTTVSAVAGVATFSTLSINNAGTGYTLSATSSGLTTATSSAFNITAGSASKIAFTVQPTNAAQGFPISPAVVVSVEDAGGNVVTTATDSITVALGANPGASTLSGTLTVSAVSGAATFSTLSLNNTGTGYTLTATDTTNGYPVVTSSAFNVTVPQVTYIQPFNSGHGWTYTQVSCAAGTFGSCASSASTTTDCATSPCVDASALDILGDTSQTGYFQSPTGTYTWQTLGIPANSTVTSVEGGWYDHASTCQGSTTAGIQIFNSTNSTEITSPSVYAVINVSGDTGTTHALGAAAAVISGYQSSSTSITLRFNLNPAATSDIDTCTLYGDNFELLINYTAATASNGPKRRGQVIVGWNREPDGSLGKMWTLNKDLPDVPTGSR